MKAETWRGMLQAVILSFLLSFGAVGSAVTGLGLNVTHMGAIALLCAFTACLTALLSRIRFGGWLVSALILGAAVGIWRIETWQSQTVDMLCRITRYYYNAYGWAIVNSPLRGNGPMDWPAACFALWIAAANCWNLSKGLRNQTGIFAAVLPLIASVVVTDTVPESIYLSIWLLGMVLVLLSQGLRRQDPRWGSYLVKIAAIPTVLALGLLFWAVPRQGYDKHPDELQRRIVEWAQELPDLWNEVQEDVASNLDGAVQVKSISLDTLGQRIKRVYPVMEVTAPVSGTVYLRGQHYDVYTADGWSVTEESRDRFEAPAVTREMGEITVTTRRVRDVIYLPYYPEDDQSLLEGCVDNAHKLDTYSFTQRSLASHWRNILESAVQNQHITRPYYNPNDRILTGENLALPEQTRQWAEDYLRRILSDEKTATEVADTIAKFVRGSARYDLATQRMPWDREDFARWFLEESETGYCVHFATAATVLLRAAGVEARYVEGYMFTARMGEETTVTADQAHAWAEYYEPVLDTWIVLEATPADLEEEAAPQPQTQAPTVPESEPETMEPSLPQRETTVPREDPDALPEGPETPENSDSGNLRWLRNCLLWVLGPGFAVLALEGQRYLRLSCLQKRFARGSRRKQVLARYRELHRFCMLLKMPISEEATHLAEKAKYSRRGAAEEEVAQLDALLKNARSALQEAPWYRKLLLRYIFAVY